jgi:zinc transporter ZupT
MTSSATLAFFAIGALLGATGQLGRVVVGMKKQMDAADQDSAKKDWFNVKKLVISVLFGMLAGIMTALAQYDASVEITKSLLLGFAGAGYAGADVVEGLFQKWLPQGMAVTPAPAD